MMVPAATLSSMSASMRSLGVSANAKDNFQRFYPKSASLKTILRIRNQRGRRGTSSSSSSSTPPPPPTTTVAENNVYSADPPPPKRKTKFGDPNNPAALGGGGVSPTSSQPKESDVLSAVATASPAPPPSPSPPPSPAAAPKVKKTKSATKAAIPASKKAKKISSARQLRPIEETPLNRGQPTCGQPSPLGATRLENESVNFALRTQNATSVTLVLYSEEDFKNGKITAEIDLDPESGFKTERAKDEAVIWHVEVPNLSENCLYGYRVNGPKLPGHAFDFNKVVLDPYAKHVC